MAHGTLGRSTDSTRRSALRVFAGVIPGALVSGFLPAAAAAMAVDDEASRPINLYPHLFGSVETCLGPARLLARTEVLARSLNHPWPERVQSASAASESDGIDPVSAWNGFLERQIGVARRAQIEAINDYCNAVPYVSDRDAEGVEDYWATPEEFFRIGGDCEDYAIAKFVSLRRLEFADQRLRVVIVYDRFRQVQHCLTAAYLNGTALILDNQAPAVNDHRTVVRYAPICSFNQASLWVHRPA
jgi:predicted transglutaminase-like cysteine proteinase